MGCKLKPKIGVMGSAMEKGSKVSKKASELAYELGREIARHNCILVNGACRGIPYIASKGAKDNDGFVIGVSPAKNLSEHVIRYKFPADKYDIIFYTGFGFKGRNVVNVSNCDAVIIISGHVGTLNEFSIAYDEGMIIGVLEGTGGIADHMKEIIRICKKKTGAQVVYDKEPHHLLKKVLSAIGKRKKNFHF